MLFLLIVLFIFKHNLYCFTILFDAKWSTAPRKCMYNLPQLEGWQTIAICHTSQGINEPSDPDTIVGS